ncbi:helix-turn-helix domain-containing protein [Curtobacterium sp. ME26]|uniref:helix-turn-helix domain-containing protein n=1 Tax=Curtobacterium sp. ME26 TaxID=2744254 RepID=UPI003988A09C
MTTNTAPCSTATTAAESDTSRSPGSTSQDLRGRRAVFTDSQIRAAIRLLDAGEPAAQVARDLGMSRATLYRRIRLLRRDDTKRS